MSSSTEDLIARRKRVLGVGAPLFYEEPLHLVRGEGVFLFDAEGKRYVDMYNNVPCVGTPTPTSSKRCGSRPRCSTCTAAICTRVCSTMPSNWARLHRLVGLPCELGYAGWGARKLAPTITH